MFLHNLKYEIKTGLRAKELIFWLMIFPLVLGTFFKIAFDGIYEKTTQFSTVPAAVVEIKENEIFRSVIDSIEDADEPLLSVTYTDEEKALELLKNGDVTGIIYVDDKLSVTVAGEGIEETILISFVEQYTTQEKIIKDTIEKNPFKISDVVSAMSEETDIIKQIPLTDGNTDNFAQYFYNLIAMVALYGTITGLHITIGNQANLSALGARKNCSPTPKSISLAASLLGSYLVQAVCMIICVTFVEFVLQIDLGSKLPLVYLAAVIGGMTGVSMGFFVGSIGNMNYGVKLGISMAVSMSCCFLSGLMVGNIKMLIAEKAPWVNDINPAAVISDSLYCLNIYNDYERFTVKIISMLIISAIFVLLGFVLSRRKKYASL
ncbi:MAG: ABC transporter permease [Oscillospiraceae bacterium]|nr:ABC transporter permease [Oscillospiraceae bacterium]